MEKTELIITNVLATGTAFAVFANDMTQNVFVPSKLSVDASLRSGQKIVAQVVPNISHPEKTPWLAISVDSASIAVNSHSLEDRISDELMNGPATVFELSNALDAEIKDIEAALRKMKLPHTDLYALDMVDLLQVNS